MATYKVGTCSIMDPFRSWRVLSTPYLISKCPLKCAPPGCPRSLSCVLLRTVRFVNLYLNRSKCTINFWIWDCYHCLICPWSYHTVPTSRCICAAYEPLKIILLASGSSLGSYLSGQLPSLGFCIHNFIVIRQTLSFHLYPQFIPLCNVHHCR